MNSRSGMWMAAVLLACGLAGCSDAPEVTHDAPAERVVDTSVLDAARALLNQPPPNSVDVTSDEWRVELEVGAMDGALPVVESPRISTAARRQADADVLEEMAQFERLRDKARGDRRDQPLEVILEER